MSNIRKKVLSILLGFGLVSILLYGVVYIVSTTPSLAVPPHVIPTPTPPPTPTPTPTPTTSPTPTPTPPTTGELEIQTIPQEDQLRKKGIMILCPDSFSYSFCSYFKEVSQVRDTHAEYKIDIRLNGENVHPDFFTCNVIEKEVCHIPPEKGGFAGEATELFDVTSHFKCVLNDSEKDGAGVLEVYYIGNPEDARFIGDHILKVEACVGGVCGAEIQDLCILGEPTCDSFRDCTSESKEPNFFFPVKWSSERLETIFKFADPIYPFASCKNLALWQRELGLTPKVAVPDCTQVTDP